MQARVNVAASKRDTCIADLAERDSTCTSLEELKFGMGSGFVSPTVLGPRLGRSRLLCKWKRCDLSENRSADESKFISSRMRLRRWNPSHGHGRNSWLKLQMWDKIGSIPKAKIERFVDVDRLVVVVSGSLASDTLLRR